MHIYAFGSICRGELDSQSDIDLLAISGNFVDLDPNTFSIYSYNRIENLWTEGNPFAWHLAFESKMIYSSDGLDFLDRLGLPNEYVNVKNDCQKFRLLFETASQSLNSNPTNYVFELSNVYLSVRNFATCFALGCLGVREFSRYSPLRIGEYSLEISQPAFSILQRARFLCTRGHGAMIGSNELDLATGEFPIIENWVDNLYSKISTNG